MNKTNETNPKTPKEVLAAVRERIARGWTQWAYARNASGESVSLSAVVDATCYCVVGAFYVVDADLDLIMKARSHLAATLGVGYSGIINWNDVEGRTQEEVLAAIDKAMETIHA